MPLSAPTSLRRAAPTAAGQSCASRAPSLELVLELAKRVAGVAVGADAPLMEAGVDSLAAVELRNQLQGTLGEGVTLSSTLIFDHPTAR